MLPQASGVRSVPHTSPTRAGRNQGSFLIDCRSYFNGGGVYVVRPSFKLTKIIFLKQNQSHTMASFVQDAANAGFTIREATRRFAKIYWQRRLHQMCQGARYWEMLTLLGTSSILYLYLYFLFVFKYCATSTSGIGVSSIKSKTLMFRGRCFRKWERNFCVNGNTNAIIYLKKPGVDQNPPIGSAILQVLGVFFDQLYQHGEI